MKTTLFFFFFFFTIIAFSQSQTNDLTLRLGMMWTPMFDKKAGGFDFKTDYYIQDAVSVGFEFGYTKPHYKQGFGYDTDRTLINSYRVGIPLQFQVVNTRDFMLSVGVTNGLLFQVLKNKNELVEVEYIDEFGSTIRLEPKKIDTDTYYILTPQATAALRLATLDTKDNLELYLSSTIGYQNVLGKGSYTKPSDFSDYIVSLGLLLKGPF